MLLSFFVFYGNNEFYSIFYFIFRFLFVGDFGVIIELLVFYLYVKFNSFGCDGWFFVVYGDDFVICKDVNWNCKCCVNIFNVSSKV